MSDMTSTLTESDIAWCVDLLRLPDDRKGTRIMMAEDFIAIGEIYYVFGTPFEFDGNSEAFNPPAFGVFDPVSERTPPPDYDKPEIWGSPVARHIPTIEIGG